MKISTLGFVVLGVLALLVQTSPAEDAAPTAAPAEQHSETTAEAGAGMKAVEQAAKADKYLFALFHKEEDEQTVAMREVLAGFVQGIADKANSVEVDVTAESESAIVRQYQLSYAPMPLVLAIAPNGAVTGGFPVRVKAEGLKAAMVSPNTAKCLKGFQDQKLVFVCIQNDKCTAATEAMQGVKDFSQDPRFAADTLVIKVDPADKQETQLLADLDVDPQANESVTVFFAPPGRFVGEFRGATNAEELVQTLVSAMYGGCGSCGPGGCGTCPPSGCTTCPPGGCGEEGCELQQQPPVTGDAADE